AHGAELVDGKMPAAIADALLAEECGSGRFQPDSNRQNEEQWRYEDENRERSKPVNDLFDLQIGLVRVERAERVLREMLDFDASGQRFHHLLDVINGRS